MYNVLSKSIFIIATPFQLLNALSVAYIDNNLCLSGKIITNDFYTVGGFDNDAEIASRLRSHSELVSDVYFLTDRGASPRVIPRNDLYLLDMMHMGVVS